MRAPLEVGFAVRAQARGSDEWQPLSPEDVLHSGDHFELTVHNSQPVYLYVARGLSDQKPVLIVPTDPAAPVRVLSTTTKLPQQGPPFELDQRSGEESIYVVASEQEVAVAKLMELFLNAPFGQAGKGREKPSEPTNKTRPTGGDRGAGGGAAPVYKAQYVAPGIMALRFSFQHRD
jgi:hypothetical protein